MASRGFRILGNYIDLVELSDPLRHDDLRSRLGPGRY